MRHVRHPLSAIFGDMAEAALLALAEDIKAKGILEPVVLYEGQVLDGWHRCKAGQIAGVEIPYTEYTGDDPGGFVLSKNLHRRQQPLTASQRAAITIKCKGWRPAGNPQLRKPSQAVDSSNSVPVPEWGDEDLAKEAEVSVSTIRHAKRAQEAGFGEAVAKGEISAKAAAEKAREVNGAPPPPPKKSPLEKAQERIVELEQRVAELEELNRDLTDNQESMQDAALGDKEMQVKFEQLRAYIRTLESQVREHQYRANQFMRECAALKKRFGVKP